MAEILKIKTGDTSSPVAKFGNGRGNLVIIPGLSVQGVTQFASSLERRYSKYLSDYTFYLIDRKEEINEGYSIKDIAEDVYSVIKALGIEETDVLGCSHGGMIAIEMAAAHPDIMRKLVLASAVDRLNDLLASRMKYWIEASRDGRGNDVFETFIDWVYSPNFRRAVKPSLMANPPIYTQKELDRFVILATSILNLEAYKNAGKVTCPTLVVGAENDDVLGGEEIKQTAKDLGAEYFGYGEGFAHSVYDEANNFADIIFDFILRK